jgi:hypothetical protein
MAIIDDYELARKIRMEGEGEGERLTRNVQRESSLKTIHHFLFASEKPPQTSRHFRFKTQIYGFAFLPVSFMSLQNNYTCVISEYYLKCDLHQSTDTIVQ